MTDNLFNTTPLYNLNSWSDLYYFNEGIYNIFTAEKQLIENSEKYISERKSELNQKVENDPELTYEPRDWQESSFQSQYYQHYYADSENILNQITQNQRKASILSIFSLIEGQLKLITSLIESEYDFKIKVKNLNGRDYLDKYWIYLTKVFGMETETVEKEYNLIKKQRFIRNKIAHNNSEIPQDSLKSIKEYKGLITVTFGEENLLEIEDIEFIYELLKTSKVFFEKLSLAIDLTYQKSKNVG